MIEVVAPSSCELAEGDSCALRDGLLEAADGKAAYSVQSSVPRPSGTPFACYRGHKGDGWARPLDEFCDGRFAPL